jgi:hypothetical protein
LMGCKGLGSLPLSPLQMRLEEAGGGYYDDSFSPVFLM